MDKDKIYNILIELGNAYKTGEFNTIFKYLDDNCVWESQWVLEARNGIEEVKKYYIEKGKLLKEHNSKCEYSVVELHHFGYSLALVISQKVNDKVNNVLLEIKFSDEYKILRIDVCNPEFYSYKKLNK